MPQKMVAETIGTFILVFFGCGSVVFMGGEIGMLGISLAFGLSIVAAAYAIGPISGAHLNPAVSLAVLLSGQIGLSEFGRYVASQLFGATLAAFVIMLIASGSDGYSVATHGLGQNGYGPGYLGEYNVLSAFLFEVIATFLFVTVILCATREKGGAGAFAGLAIGLTLAAIHLVGINITGVSVNPARSFGPAVFAGTSALGDLWLFIVAPFVGAVLAGWLELSGLTGTAEG